MSAAPPAFVPYPPIEAHGVIGDRHTAALVAADGTLDWLCLPCYDGAPLFGALLDAERGGFWRLGPAAPALSRQRYDGDSAALVTTWDVDGAALELTDAMAWPQHDRPPELTDRRAVVRRLRCTAGVAACALDLRAWDLFAEEASVGPPSVEPSADGLVIRVGQHALGLWASRPLEPTPDGAHASFRLRAGEEVWAVLAVGEGPDLWSSRRADETLAEAIEQTREWSDHLDFPADDPRDAMVRRAALVVHLLSYTTAGSLVAAPTTSLPERIGGDRNYDYRYAWVRDASLSIAMLVFLRDPSCAEGYLRWLSELGSTTGAPCHVVYRVDGGTDLDQQERTHLDGYRGSRPVRLGNHAAGQRQLDSVGYLVDCIRIHLEQGGDWRDEYWEMVRGAAEYTAEHWQQPDSGIWELPEEAQYLSSKVMAWVALDRAVTIAERVGRHEEARPWRAVAEEIHAYVMEQGWSERAGAFVQRCRADNLDASALLIPIVGFLPADHPRVVATVDRIAETLAIDGFVHRFLAAETPGQGHLPLGEFEGAFLPCTFWLATACAMMGRADEAERILARAEAVAPLGLFPEQVDARTGRHLGNTPLLFSQIEYLRAVFFLTRARNEPIPLAAP